MLKQFVSVYVPGTLGLPAVKRDLTTAEQKTYTQQVARQLSAKFGGATVTNGTGYYVADNGDLVEETVQIVKSYHDDTAGAVEFAIELATWIKSELQQELVSVETESGLLFV